jgi:hypothetical protein
MNKLSANVISQQLPSSFPYSKAVFYASIILNTWQMADLHDYVLSQDIQDNVNISVNDD